MASANARSDSAKSETGSAGGAKSPGSTAKTFAVASTSRVEAAWAAARADARSLGSPRSRSEGTAKSEGAKSETAKSASSLGRSEGKGTEVTVV